MKNVLLLLLLLVGFSKNLNAQPFLCSSFNHFSLFYYDEAGQNRHFRSFEFSDDCSSVNIRPFVEEQPVASEEGAAQWNENILINNMWQEPKNLVRRSHFSVPNAYRRIKIEFLASEQAIVIEGQNEREVLGEKIREHSRSKIFMHNDKLVEIYESWTSEWNETVGTWIKTWSNENARELATSL